jgi:hypothetical protein
MDNKPSLKIAEGVDHIVEFLYDTPKEGVNSYGKWHLYGLNHGGSEVGLFATDALHEKLVKFRTGDKVNIRKEEFAPGKLGWNIIPEEGTVPSRSESKAPSKSDDRTHDIHKQVCLKLAVELMGKKKGTLTEGDGVVLEANMYYLLGILEGTGSVNTDADNADNEEEDLPF